jgi:hypothetical protein
MAPASFDEKKSAVRAVATTEKPVRVFDYDVYDYVDEVLRMDGVVLPASGRVSLLDSHNRYGVASVLGSAGDFTQAEAGGYRALETEVIYSATDEGQIAAKKTNEGHLTDYSVGYRVLESYFVPDGQKQIIGSDEYEGPVRVVTRWELKELSATPIGADEYAKARSDNQIRKEKSMPGTTEETKKTPETQADTQGARIETAQPAPSGGGQDSGKQETRAAAVPDQAAVDKLVRDAVRAETDRCMEIRRRCSVAGLDAGVAEDMIQRSLTMDAVSDEIFSKLAEKNPAVGSGRTQVVVEARDKFRAAAIDGICLRSGMGVEKPAAGHEDFRGRSLLRLAEECVAMAGGNVRGLNKMEIAGMALGLSGRSVPTTSTSDFPLIMSNVANKRLLKAWEEAAVTWDVFCSIVDGVDFKPMQGIDISALPVLDLLGESGEYKDVHISETGESYMIKTFGNMFKMTRHMIVNDDMRVFLKVPRMFGAAAKRTINQHVYALLNSNPEMADGKALFHADHGNIMSTAGAPAKATISQGRQLMRQLKDPGDIVNLNLTPKYLVCGSMYETDVDIILLSAALPETDMSSGVINPFKAKITPVIDAVQDGLDEDAWFLFPDKTASDAIEVAFLDGVQTPYLEDMIDFDTDGIKYKCRIDFGVGAMSHRIIKNTGA